MSHTVYNRTPYKPPASLVLLRSFMQLFWSDQRFFHNPVIIKSPGAFLFECLPDGKHKFQCYEGNNDPFKVIGMLDPDLV